MTNEATRNGSQGLADAKPSASGTPTVSGGAASDSTLTAGYLLESEADMMHYPGIHDGKGSLGIKLFGFNQAAHPANFVVFDIPPGASEGVHVHDSADPESAFDEFYYVIAGHGTMDINGHAVAVKAGDHVYVPLNVKRGIENTSSGKLKVLITYISRATCHRQQDQRQPD